MSILYCSICDKYIDTEHDADYFDQRAEKKDKPPVEVIDWSEKSNKPLDKLFLKQKQEATKHECRHLQGLKPVTIIDHVHDRTFDVEVCRLCGKEIDALEKKQIELTLKKYEQFRTNSKKLR